MRNNSVGHVSLACRSNQMSALARLERTSGIWPGLDKIASKALDALTRGLTGENFRDGSIGSGRF